MPFHSPPLLKRFRQWRGFIQAVVFAMLVQAFLPAGMALASDVQPDTDFDFSICRVLSQFDENDQSNDDGAQDCAMCLAMDAGNILLSVPPSVVSNGSVTPSPKTSFSNDSRTAAYRGISQQVRAPPFA